MERVTGLLVVALTSLLGRVGGTEPSGGYCIGTQCFTVVQDPSDFTGARQQCDGQGGHLMTVRTTVAHDLLLILLGNLTGRFWLGLHRAPGCPDAAAALRGFRWVTGDGESDFFNWAQTFDGSCSSRRCVSVSKDDEFKWTPEPCDEHAAGFLCEFAFDEPCKRLAAAEGESVAYRTPMGIGGENVLSLPPGSTAIRTPAKTKYLCASQRWLPAPWSCDTQEGGCEHKCVLDAKRAPSCRCPPGRSVNPANNVTCEEGDDPCASLRCAHRCSGSGGSHACACDRGFSLAPDGRSCVEPDGCADERRRCPGENSVCVSAVGGAQCVCRAGYKLSGGRCVDVDECVSAPCEHMCANAPGSYRCACYDGYKADPQSPNTCRLHCGEAECAAECDPNDQLRCECPDGYVMDDREPGSVCVDIDECLYMYCDQGCENTFGSYACSCSRGYTLDGQFRCVKTEDGEFLGSTAAATPRVPATPPAPSPGPTRRPAAVTAGGLVGIIVCTVFFVALVLFLAHRILTGRGKMERGGPEAEAHGLHRVTGDTVTETEKQ